MKHNLALLIALLLAPLAALHAQHGVIREYAALAPNRMRFRSPRCSMRRSRTPASRSGRTRRFISRVPRWVTT